MIKTKVNDEAICVTLRKYRTETLKISIREYADIVELDNFTLMRAEIRMTASARNFLLLMYMANLRIEDFIIEEEGVGVQKSML